MRDPRTSTAKSARRKLPLTLLGVLAALAAVSVAGFALAKDSLPAPTLSATPANATKSQSASFTYNDSRPVTKFQCSLDGSPFQDCGTTRPSSKGYSGLADGSHSFQVRAISDSQTSSAASFTWVIDRTPPALAPTITSGPSGLVASTTAKLAFHSSEAGVAGYRCQLDGGAAQACDSPQLYTHLGQGTHTFKVMAVDAAENVGPPASRTWTVDTIPPPTPTFSQEPPNPSPSPVSTFAWASHPAGDVDHYQCREEDHAWLTCASPLTFTVSSSDHGEHHFAVRALDAAGNVSEEAKYKWKVAAGGSGLPFTISGSAGGQLYPGAPSRQIPLTLTNPNGVVIYVTSLTVAITSSPVGCPAASNLVLTQSSASSATPVQVPAGGSVTLPAQGVSAPSIQLLDLPVNQDACKGTGFGLTYAGSAHS